MDDLEQLQRQPYPGTRNLSPCRQCGASTFHRSPRRSLWDHLLSLIGFSPVRCTQCYGRRYRFRPQFPLTR
jgi:hypothetical protein